ncbi:MAG TPA: hypothetical protein VG426_08475 [Candidatus Dormibacteraeota bacterium]|jgi:hypothetical protein|nr:hypothetical protein [Candidatus Dormibacteraeota bacterium]
MTDVRQVGQIAGRYRDLQGLRQVAGGIGLLLLFAYEMVAPLTLSDFRAAGIGRALWGIGAVAVGFGLVVAAVAWISGWYRRNYGSVEQTARQRRMGRFLGAAGALAFLVPFNLDSIAMNSGNTLPVNLMDFTLALWIVGYWFYLGRSFRHYLVLAGVGLVLGLASIAGLPPASFAWHLREATLYFAVATIVGGLIDHRILTNALPRVDTEVSLGS